MSITNQGIKVAHSQKNENKNKKEKPASNSKQHETIVAKH
jgi:hypothetical protein